MPRPSLAVRPLTTLLFAVLIVFPAAGSTGPVAKSHKTAPTTKVVAPQAATPQPETSPALLPEIFAGWELTDKPLQSDHPEAADDGNAPVLREYGFTRYEAATYTRNHGTMTVKAIEFADATGAYGSFTFYRTPNMTPEKIGQGAAFDGARVLFWQGKMLVDVKFTHLTPMSVSELRDLATLLPKPVGNQGTLPTLPGYLPQKNLDPLTVQYAIGPQAYQRTGGVGGPVLPAALVDFNRSAEVVSAQYSVQYSVTNGALTIINYPTPEIAIDRQHAIQAYLSTHGAGPGQAQASGQAQAGNPTQYPWTTALSDSNSAALLSRRSGPLVLVTSGAFSTQDAQQMLQRVHYEVNMTMSNGAGPRSDSSKVAQIILSVAVMVGLFALIAIVAGVSLGGGRIAWRKMRGKSALTSEESSEFIRLNLKD